MVGATPELFATLQPVLAQMGRNIVHCGEVGTGQIAKICNNLLLGISMVGVSEAMALGDALALTVMTLVVGTEIKGATRWINLGGFSLQHSGTMTRGAPELNVTVVPDSGTGELSGLSGKMTINIVDGKHLYEMDYAIADNTH